MAWFAAGPACAPCLPLEDVPLIDAPEGGEATWAEAVRVFRSWVGGEGVCLTRVVVDPGKWVDGVSGLPANGVYARREKALFITSDAFAWGSPPGATVLHEICHALDYQRGHRSDQMGFPDFVRTGGHWDRFTRQREWSPEAETFAILCSLGPEFSELTVGLSSQCGEPEAAVAAQGMLDDVFLPSPPALHDALIRPVPIGSRPPTDPDLSFDVASLRTTTYAFLGYGLGERGVSAETALVDLFSGEDVENPLGAPKDMMWYWVGRVYGPEESDRPLTTGRRVHLSAGSVYAFDIDVPGVQPFTAMAVSDSEGPPYTPVAGSCSRGTVEAVGSVQGIWFFTETDDGVRWSLWKLPEAEPPEGFGEP